ncbi:MAG: hypothetical protein J5769_05420 [Bacteroidales bacterium]|nr:hypothetical protein [Bacteroidales bacterium]
MKKVVILLFAVFAMAFTVFAQVSYPENPAACENLFLQVNADTVYFYNRGPGKPFAWTGNNEAACFRDFLVNEGNFHGSPVYDNIIVYVDDKTTVSFAVELSNALEESAVMNNVVFVIPPKYWHENPVSMVFTRSSESPMTMEEFLADQKKEKLGVTFTMYEEGQGLWKQRPDSYLKYTEGNIHDLVSNLKTGEDYPYLHIKVPQVVTLVNYVAAIDQLGRVKQENPMRVVETCYVPSAASGEVMSFDYNFARPDFFVPTVDEGKEIHQSDCERLGLASLPVFTFTNRSDSFECTPGGFYYKNGDKNETYSFWAGSQSDPRARIGGYFLDFTVCIDGSVKDIRPSERWAQHHPQKDWDYVIERLAEEATWRPSHDATGKPVNVRLYEVRVFLSF